MAVIREVLLVEDTLDLLIRLPSAFFDKVIRISIPFGNWKDIEQE